MTYISREAAYKTLTEYYHHSSGVQYTVLREALNRVPTADVVEVVRCKDCGYYYKDSDGYEMCDNTECYDHISADGFCAWAKRRQTHDIMGYAR